MAASHLNDKDALVGRTGVAQSPVMLCPPPSWLRWAGDQTEVPLCPHIRDGGAGGAAISYKPVPCISQVLNFKAEAGPGLGNGLLLGVSGVLFLPAGGQEHPAAVAARCPRAAAHPGPAALPLPPALG